MEITMTELFLFLWAVLATGFGFLYKERYDTMARLLYMVSTDLRVRKEFFEAHDKHFKELVK